MPYNFRALNTLLFASKIAFDDGIRYSGTLYLKWSIDLGWTI